MKKLIKLLLGLLVLFFVVKLCTSNLGSVISLPGGMGGSSSDDSGGWFTPKGNTSGKSIEDISLDLEKELGVGNGSGSSGIEVPSAPTTSNASSPLIFKGIPISGTLSSFGAELVKGGFTNSGNGTYTGTFAGYDGCEVTPIGNPVREVRVDFPVISDWDSLEKSYDSLQASLTQKYALEPKVSSDNNLAIYNLPNGTITLDADVRQQSTWHVVLRYTNQTADGSSIIVGTNPMDDL